MEKKPLLSKPLKLLKNERWRPYVRYEKETGAWIAKAIREERPGREKMEETVDKISFCHKLWIKHHTFIYSL